MGLSIPIPIAIPTPMLIRIPLKVTGVGFQVSDLSRPPPSVLRHLSSVIRAISDNQFWIRCHPESQARKRFGDLVIGSPMSVVLKPFAHA